MPSRAANPGRNEDSMNIVIEYAGEKQIRLEAMEEQEVGLNPYAEIALRKEFSKKRKQVEDAADGYCRNKLTLDEAMKMIAEV